MPAATFRPTAEVIAEAHRQLAEHVTLWTQLCAACGVEGPCAVAQDAMRTLALRGELPRRAPQATRAYLAGLRPLSGPSVWAAAAGEDGAA
ncbi:hypothetical protein HC028_17250 [Planosporangium flavigriseum]|uniref:Uncharacterized protein n=1 Tax=Planosporangium flavigriseum TaxID=373681 RepID=A0A8J3LVP2_9ACTN|nr:hypothetical protein [Planosporangium flavigriseum]NJC66237.1 hypothetical protein [Planosporangium flavigriseum]GIG74694.1 hypothetical protein Pfl04_30980 [Planosporangium flavigriseum]